MGLLRLPALHPQVWILVTGRFMSQIGTGIVMFYVPLYFVNQAGLSAIAVGGALSSAAIASILGYFLAGTLVDTPGWGRRRTLIAACSLSILADGVFLVGHSLPLLILANLLLGLGDSLYWPASGAAIADLTQGQERDTAFAISGLADSLATGLGIVIGGLLITIQGSYTILFWFDGLTFLAFLIVLTLYVEDSRPRVGGTERKTTLGIWWSAITNPRFAVFAIANILFTTYMNWMESTLPLYFTRYASPEGQGFTSEIVGLMFSGYVLFVALAQLPVVQRLSNVNRVDVLRLSMLLWGGGFGLVAALGLVPTGQTALATGALGTLAMANITYNPFSVAWVSDLARSHTRGVYLSLNAQCWSIGYLAGPVIGGWAIDQSSAVARNFWFAACLSTGIGFLVLTGLKCCITHKPHLGSS